MYVSKFVGLAFLPPLLLLLLPPIERHFSATTTPNSLSRIFTTGTIPAFTPNPTGQSNFVDLRQDYMYCIAEYEITEKKANIISDLYT